MASLKGLYGLEALPQDSNNPFSIIQTSPSSWQGLVPGSTGFLKFTSPMYGVRAGFINLINTYLSKGLDTIEKIFPVYAPASDARNNPSAYIASVEKMTGIPRATKITTPDQIYKVGKAIVSVENGNFWVPQADFDAGFKAAMDAKKIAVVAKAGGIGLGAIAVGLGVWYFFIRSKKKEAV